MICGRLSPSTPRLRRSELEFKIFCFEFEILNLSSLLEKGRQMLMKDNLIDEEKAKQEEAAQENLLQKIDRLVPTAD